MNRYLTLSMASVCLLCSCLTGRTATKYWDINDATPGAGGPTPGGPWDLTSSRWTMDPSGSSAATTFADGDIAVFSAGSDATGAYGISLTAVRPVGGMLVKDGIASFSGSAINLGANTVTVNNGAVMAYPTIASFSVAAGSALVLDNGTARITGAAGGSGSPFWSATSDFKLGLGGGTIDVNSGGIALYTGANGITLAAGTTAATMIKIGAGEFRPQKATFTKLIVNQGLWRINTGGTESGFGAVPSSYVPDAITVNNAGLGTSISITTSANRGITVASGNCTFVLNAGWAVNSIITGPGGIAVNGNGFSGSPSQQLTLAGANTYLGNTTINPGILSVGSDGNLGLVPSSFTANSLVLNGGTLNANATFAINNNRGIRLTASSTLDVSSSRTLTCNSVISGAANTFGLTKTASGTLTLAGANTFGGGSGGDLTITGGSVNFNDNNAAGLGKIVATPASAVTLRNSVLSTVLPNALTVNSGTSTINLLATVGNSLTLKGPITGVAPIIRGDGGGAGIVGLAGANTGWSGGLEHRGGILELGHKNALGTGGFNITGTKLTTTTVQASISLTGTEALTNAVSVNTNVIFGGVNDLEFAGPVNLGSAGRSLTVTNATSTISGVISGSSTLTKDGSGTLILSGSDNNTYTGPTTINGGRLLLAKSSGNAVNGNLTINGGVVQLGASEQIPDVTSVIIDGGILDLSVNSETVSSLLLTNGSVIGTGTLTAGAYDLRGGAISATLAGAGSILTKTTINTVTLGAASTYSGGTIVSGGTLIVENATGSATGPGTVAVLAGASLGGKGSVAGTVELSGTIAPGNSPGTLTTGPETWHGGASYSWQINNATNTGGADPGWDLISISGGLNLAAAASNRFTINVTSLTSANVPGLIDGLDLSASNAWTIVHMTEGITNFDASAFHIVQSGFSNDLGGQTFVIMTNETGNDLVLFLKTNSVPTLIVPGDVTIDELTNLSVTNTASDPDAGSIISFSLISPPSGMLMGTDTGIITWTPTEAQGPGTYVITVVVSDDAQVPLSVTNSFTVTVKEVNNPPGLTVPGNQTIDELSNLSVSATATDSDVPANQVTFSLIAPPTGMTIDAHTGAISWTPDEGQGPGLYTITVVATDDGSPVASVTNTFQVTVNEVNSAPTLTMPADQTIDELTALAVSASVSDSDIPANTHTFSLLSPPTGMVIDSATGAIGWTPDEGQGPSVNTITVVVTDNGTPALSATNTFVVTVKEANTAPTLTVPGDQTLDELTALSVSASALDSDVPANTLTFSLVSPPAGMSIDAGTGAITWTPTEAQGPCTNVITVVVTDNGVPPLSATNSFLVTVKEVNNGAPVLTVPSDQTLNELTTLTVTNTATDVDVPSVLTFSLVDPPTGMTIDATNGVIVWTPTEAQGPSAQLVTVVVTDDGNPVSSATNTFTVTVNEVNSTPVLTVPADVTIAELTPLAVSASATDSDIPGNTLTFSLVSPPAGMSIDAATGAIGWTPTEAQGPSTEVITVVVTDNGNPALSATNTFTVTVSEVNSAPVLTVPADVAIAELTPMAVSASATDPDVPANTLTFSLILPPTGMSIDPVSGAISWEPTEAQGPSTNIITVVVTDNGNPAVSATNTFTVTVSEANSAPVLAGITDRIIHAGSTLIITNIATDSDVPTNTLTFSLDAGVPSGASIDSNTGVLTLVTTAADAGTTNTITVRVTDNGVPPSSAPQTFTVAVLADPHISSIALSNEVVTLTWSSISGQKYRVQYRDSLDTGTWASLSPDVTASDSTASATDSVGTNVQRYYRILVLEP